MTAPDGSRSWTSRKATPTRAIPLSHSLNMAESPRAVFPTTEEEFKNDVRVSFDKSSSKWILEDDNGDEYEWNAQFEKWVPSVDEALMQQQASIYAMKDVDETAPAIDSKKRKADVKATKQDKKAKIDRPNSAVYVSGIPLDANIDEIHDVFKKYGIIEEDIHTNLPKIRMYADDEGTFKGEAKVIYFKPQSVSLAITMLDGTDFRKPGDGDLHVELVDDSYSNRNKDPAGQKEKKEVSVENIKKRRPKQDRYLAIAPPPNPSKYAKIVVLKHMFTLEELEEDAGALIDIKADIRDEASKYGEVTNTVLYDLEPQGVVTVRFKEADSAVLCAEAFNGRWFDKRRVIAYVPQHREDFAKSKGSGQDGLQDIDEDEPDDDDDEKERVAGSAVEGHRTLEAEKEKDTAAEA
jgi:HIV Tat-specific factor 1